MLDGKGIIIHWIVGLIKRHNINEWIFPKTKIFRTNVKL